jgi:hypothetical protein
MAGGFTKLYSRVATRLSTANQRGPSLWKAENVDVDAHKSRTQSSAAGKGQGRPSLPGDCHDLCRRQRDSLLDLAADLVSILSQAVQFYIIDPYTQLAAGHTFSELKDLKNKVSPPQRCLVIVCVFHGAFW